MSTCAPHLEHFSLDGVSVRSRLTTCPRLQMAACLYVPVGIGCESYPRPRRSRVIAQPPPSGSRVSQAARNSVRDRAPNLYRTPRHRNTGARHHRPTRPSSRSSSEMAQRTIARAGPAPPFAGDHRSGSLAVVLAWLVALRRARAYRALAMPTSHRSSRQDPQTRAQQTGLRNESDAVRMTGPQLLEVIEPVELVALSWDSARSASARSSTRTSGSTEPHAGLADHARQPTADET